MIVTNGTLQITEKGTSVTVYFYGRCSTEAQNLARQVEAAKKVGIAEQNMFLDKMSGTKRNRPALDSLLDTVKPGDEVICLELSRLSRSMTDMLALVGQFKERGVTLHFLHEGLKLGTNSPSETLALQIFTAIYEFQRSLILQSTAEGRAAKIKATGKCGGRKPLSSAIKNAICEMKDRGCSIKEITDQLSVSKASIYRTINERDARSASI